MKLNELRKVCENVDIDEYIKSYEIVLNNIKDNNWLGRFSKDEIDTILKDGGKICIYYDGDIIACSWFYIPSSRGVLSKHEINLDYKVVGSCGPIMVNPNYIGNSLQYQMLIDLDNYCKTIGMKYIFTKVSSDNIYSINNFIKDGYRYVNTYESKNGLKNIYIKEL